MSKTPVHSASVDAVVDGEVQAPSNNKELSAQGGPDVAKEVLGVIGAILKGIERDNENRGEFTKKTVGTMQQQYPSFNWMCIHTKHDYQWDGTRGEDWDHWHEEFDIKVGGTIGFEIYWFRSGHFYRHGDGGFQNWAYIGNVVSRSDDGRDLRFAAP